MAANLLQHAQNMVLLLVLATAICTLVGAWFAAESKNGLVWLFLVATASCGISAIVALMLLPMITGFNGLTLLDAVLCLVVAIGAVRTWIGMLDQVDWGVR